MAGPTATFRADFSQWEEALKHAAATLKAFEVDAKTAARQFQRALDSFDGSKIKTDALAAAAAVKEIGGAGALTANEQRKLNALVTEALDKYKALGQVAPKELHDLAEATKQVAKPTEAAAESVGSLAAKYVSIGAAVLLAKQAIGGLTDFLQSSVKSYADAEASQNRMVAALRAQGTATPTVIKQYTELASTIQKTTAFSDDAANEMTALFVQIGNVGPQEMGKAAKAATDLAAGLGVDLRDATLLVAKALEGNVGALGRYGVKIDAARVAAEGADVVFGAINERFGGQASAQLDTYAGRLANIANLWDDFKEAVGEAIVKDESIQQLMRDAPAIIASMTTAFGLFADGIRKAHSVWEDLMNAITFGASQRAKEFRELSAAADKAKIDLDWLGRETRRPDTFSDTELPAPPPMLISPKGLQPGETFEAIDAKLRKHTVALIESSKAAEEFAKEYAVWSKSVTGLDKVLAATKLETKLKLLTAEGKLNAEATQAIIKEYDALRPSLDHLSEPLERLRTNYQHVLESTRLFGGAMTELMRVVVNGDRLFEEGQTAVRQYGVHLKYLESTSIDVAVAMKAVPGAITGISTAMKAADPQSFANSLKRSLKDLALDLPKLISDIFSGNLKGEALGKTIGAMIGGAIGAGIGWFFGGPFGSMLGASAGSAIGQGIAEMFSTKAEQTARRVAREFGVSITEEMGQAIVDTAKNMFGGNQVAAQIFSLPDIIQAAGGLNSFNIGPMFDRLHDVFTMIQTGAFSAAQGMEVLDKTFKQFADFVTDRGTLASKQLLDIIKLNEQYGTSSKAVAEFVTAQITGAFTGLTTFLDNAKVSSNEAASSISAAIFGAFEALQKQGATPLEAFNAVGPALEKLDAQLKAAGLDGGAAFQTMMQYAGLAKDAVAGPLLTAIAGLNDVFHGLHNAGVLNQEMFGGLAKQVSDTYNQLVLAGKGGQQALQLIAPTLQTLWEEMTDFGYVVDDATKALIDQGVQAGLVGDKQRSAQDKMLKAVERTAEAVEALAHLFGATLPSDIQKTTDAINKIPRDVKIGVQYSDSGFTPQPTAPTGGTGTRVMAHAAGGVFSQPHLAYVAEGGQPEMVGSVGFMTRALEGALARVQTSGGVTVIPVVINGSASADDVDAVLAALVRAEPRITGNAGGVRSALLRALGR